MTEDADPGHVEHRVVPVERKRMAQLRRVKCPLSGR